eukprot:scaffold20397_cov62-Phaeocystis_antarctica.AAC.4
MASALQVPPSPPPTHTLITGHADPKDTEAQPGSSRERRHPPGPRGHPRCSGLAPRQLPPPTAAAGCGQGPLRRSVTSAGPPAWAASRPRKLELVSARRGAAESPSWSAIDTAQYVQPSPADPANTARPPPGAKYA